jgi:hypothetical protein
LIRPLAQLSGKPNTWAGAIVRTIGWVNFLDDPSQKPHMALRDLDRMFGIGGSTGQTKSAQIRKILKIDRFEPQWTLASKLDENPRAWMIEVNGFIMDARSASPEIQEEAFGRGLIPYLPRPAAPMEKAAKPAKKRFQGPDLSVGPGRHGPARGACETTSKADPAPPPPKKEDPDQMKLF